MVDVQRDAQTQDVSKMHKSILFLSERESIGSRVDVYDKSCSFFKSKAALWNVFI